MKPPDTTLYVVVDHDGSPQFAWSFRSDALEDAASLNAERLVKIGPDAGKGFAVHRYVLSVTPREAEEGNGT